MNESQLLADAVAYFKLDDSMQGLAYALAKKYYQYGSFKGRINHQVFTSENLSRLQRFVQQNPFDWQRQKSLPVAKVLAAYNNSRFAPIPLTEVIAQVIGQPLITKVQAQNEQAQALAKFKQQLQVSGQSIWQNFSSKQQQALFKYWQKQPNKVLVAIKLAGQAFQKLPTVYQRLPYFAYQLTGDPHSLDRNRLAGRLFYELLYGQGAWDTQLPSENQVYTTAHLLKDDMMNFVAVQNITSADDAAWQTLAQQHIAWNAPLKAILEVGTLQTPQERPFFMIENAGVFSLLSELFPEVPLICTNGQFRYAVWCLLDRLTQTSHGYYSGDFDPAGLTMAAHLLQRYPQQISLFAMDHASYLASQPSKLIVEPNQLKQLQQLVQPELQELKMAILERKCAGYQEGITSKLVAEIKRLY